MHKTALLKGPGAKPFPIVGKHLAALFITQDAGPCLADLHLS